MSDQKNQYEGMYVLGPNLADQAREKLLNNIKEGIESRGGEIQKIHDMGRKKLAYKINRHGEAYYYLIYFTLNADQIKPMWMDYRLWEEDGLLRFMTLRTDEVKEELEFPALSSGN